MGDNGQTYKFYLTVSGYMDPVEEKKEELTEDDKRINEILTQNTYGIINKKTKKSYTAALYYDVTDKNSMIIAAHDGLERGAKEIHFRFTSHDADYWLDVFSDIRQHRSECANYTSYYGYEKKSGELVINPTYKDGWKVVLAMRFSGYEIDEKAQKLWRESYRLAKEAYDMYPGNIRDMLLYINNTFCDWVEYTYSNNDHDDASGVFLDHKAVCAGYTSALNLVCNILGIENRDVVSTSGDHTWNNVKLDGIWYHIDVTFNDQKGNDGNYLNDFFMLTDEELEVEKYNYKNPQSHDYPEFVVE